MAQLVDQLVSQSAFEVALQVTATCRVDPFDVHAAWGMSYLQCGLLDMARTKFEKCFTSKSVSEVLENEPHRLIRLIVLQRSLRLARLLRKILGCLKKP